MTPQARSVAFCLVVVALLLCSGVSATLPTNPSEHYTHIVVGAGTAGCIVAARLSENPANKVLLLGAGGDTSNSTYSVLPFTAQAANAAVPSDFARYENIIKTIEGANFGRRSLDAVIAQALGGASAINGGVFMRPACSDYDKLASLGITGWSCSHINSTIWSLIENYIPWNGGSVPSGHFTSGNTQVRAVPPDMFLSAIMASFANVTDTSIIDLGVGNVRGTGVYPRPLGDGGNPYASQTGDWVRQSTYTTYIKSIMNSRPNLRVICGALVTRLGRSGSCNPGSRSPCFNQVTFVYQGVSQVAQVALGGEIVLSAGALGTPKILVHSGVGDCDYLRTLGIDCVYNNTGIGQAFSNHLLLGQLWVVPMAPDYSSHIGSICASYISVGRTDGVINMEIAYASDLYVAAPGVEYQLVVMEHEYTQPWSTGTLALQEADFNAPVNVSLGVFDNAADLAPFIESYKLARQAMAQSGIPAEEISLSGKPNIPPVGATDAEIGTYIMGALGDDYHYVATTRMGLCSQGAAVDDQACLCGVSGVRIADNGIFPFPYSGHTTHPGAMIIGEQVAWLMKNEAIQRPQS